MIWQGLNGIELNDSGVFCFLLFFLTFKKEKEMLAGWIHIYNCVGGHGDKDNIFAPFFLSDSILKKN